MALIILPPGSTGIDLQTAIDQSAFGDVIQISGDMPFTNTVTIRAGLEITLQSDDGNQWKVLHYSPGKRHFEIDGSLILENIILDGRNDSGGVQLNQGAFAMLDNAIVENCSADNGGGIYVIRGVCSIYGGEVRNNTAQNGGGVYLTAGMFNMSASYGVIRGNHAGNGGGIYVNGGTYRLTGGSILENEALHGGGLYLYSGSLNMSRGDFISNIALTNGGGIYVASTATLEISGNAVSIAENTASEGTGGGIYTEHETYANLSCGSELAFRCNKASSAYAPPENASTLYPDICFSTTTITEHPLNSYDINYTEGEPIIVTHHVTYDANGGIGTHTGPDIGPCETDTADSLEETGIRRHGHTFTGWNTTPDGKGVSYLPGDTIELDGNITLYAQWIRNEPKPPYCDDFCCKFCQDFCDAFSKEFCEELSRSCCNICFRKCYKICHCICCKICCSICRKSCRRCSD